MLELAKGYQVSDVVFLSEGFEQVSENYIFANINCSKLKDVFQHFIVLNAEEPLFFILELPVEMDREELVGPDVIEKSHKDVYYIDGLSFEKALVLFERYAELLINDGMVTFGFGCHLSGDEIMMDKYNVVTIYSPSISKYEDFFEPHGIDKVEKLLTAWQTFTADKPGITSRYDMDGLSVYDLPRTLKDWNIYLAETREE